jgi:phenylpropionate dioxygenase-like ring-hydroxylating dioxygenase large terminal subunit
MNAISPIDLEPVLQPVATARGLPSSFYTDSKLYDLEREKVFARNWACIGFGKDVPNPGDLRPITFLGQPLLIARGRDGLIRVFENVCRHRGAILLSEPANGRPVIRCPYHSWCYGLDGKLVTTPHVGGAGHNTHPEIKRDELGLFEVRSYVWLDMIFVNLSKSAPEFRESAADLIERFAEFDQRALHHGGGDSSFKIQLKANWKLAVENYAESYHLPWIHPGLNSYSRLEDHYNMVERSFCGQGSYAYTPSFGPKGERFEQFTGLSEKWKKGAEYPCIFPNVLVGFQNDHIFIIQLEPVAQDATIEHIEIYYADKTMTEPPLAAMREKNANMWKDIFVEDIDVVQRMQKGRHAPSFDGGKFSPVMDGPTHRFHEWVAQQMTA